MLAVTQSSIVARHLEAACPGLTVELITIKTTGDRVTDRPLAEVGGKGVFTKELEQALLDDRIDFAVHSYKDVPTTMPLVDQSRLVIASVPQREDPRDVLIARFPLGEMPPGSRIATGSLRRLCQIKAVRPDVAVVAIRGNIDTRLGKWRAGEFDGVVLAAAGLRRAGLWDDTIMHPINVELMTPAPGQGALALQCRAEDQRVIDMLRRIDDEATAVCVAAERSVVAALEGDCHSPIGAHATWRDGAVHVSAMVGVAGGNGPIIRAGGGAGEVIESLRAGGAMQMLHGARQTGA